MKVAVTGTTGFIGSHLVPALLKEGWSVAEVLEPGVGGEVAGAKAFVADVVSGEGLAPALQGADAVVHLAARGHILKERAADPLGEYRQVNVEGTRNVVREAVRSGVKTLIHLSSVKAMGEGCEDVLDENSPCAPRTPYGISKWESEQVVRTEAAGMNAMILRLPMVYGPGNKGNLPRMVRWADQGRLFPVFQPDNLRSMVYVGNVVAALVMLLAKPKSGVTTYIVKDQEDYSTRMVYTEVCKALGKKPRFLSIPGWTVRVGGWFSEDFRKVTGSFQVSSEKFVKDYGFYPSFSLEQGIVETVSWYRTT